MSSGEILINGTNIKHFTQNSLRSKIALVPQRTFIFNDTIANNIIYGESYDKNRLRESIQQADAGFIYDLDDAEETLLDEFGANLSGGQRQRIAIARAIYKQPDIYIFDEATSALDNTSQEHIKQTIKKLCTNKIVIIIAHRLSAIEYADKILLFRDGNIIASGSHDELKDNATFQGFIQKDESQNK